MSSTLVLTQEPERKRYQEKPYYLNLKDIKNVHLETIEVIEEVVATAEVATAIESQEGISFNNILLYKKTLGIIPGVSFF